MGKLISSLYNILKYLSVSNINRTIKLWDLKTFTKPILTLRDQSREVWSVAWRPQPVRSSTAIEGIAGSTLSSGAFVSGGADGTLRFYRGTGS